MKILLLIFVLLSSKAIALEPNRESLLVNDPFSNYQWGLYNKGQRLYRDTDDIHPEIRESKEGYDIQWRELQNILNGKNRKDTVVAVIDSGLSVSHDDIKDNALKGFNFVTTNEQMQQLVNDEIGHGTHIAGIIAAHIADAKGIAGVASNIKILPLKVYGGGKESSETAFIERVAKAIHYAIDQNVDVINMSMGWPLVIDLPVIRNAIQKALKHNITIVAGAGNDGHALRVLPCSYEGVICVGSTGIAGDIPGFSNYGGQVDIMAPGESILSLWPPLLTPPNFGLKNYNVASGTSQSAPFVSAAAAILKSLIPGISNDEIKARLFVSSRKDITWNQKFALNGLLQIASAIKVTPRAVVRPVLKSLDQVYVEAQSNAFSFELPIKNYWANASGILIKLDSSNSNIEWSQKNYSLSGLAEGKTQTLKIRGRIKDLSKNYKLKFTVEIQNSGQKEIFAHESTLSLKMNSLKNVKKYTGLGRLESVLDFNANGKNVEFYSQTVSEEGLTVEVYRATKNGVESGGQFYIPYGAGLYPKAGFVRLDYNKDGQDDYFVSAIIKKDKTVEIKHYVLNQEMNLLNGERSQWNFVDEGIIIHQPSLKFVEWDSKELGKVSLPIFWSQGKIPAADLNPDPFDRINSVSRGLFYFMPVVADGEVKTQTRLLNSEANMAQIRKMIGARFDEEITLLNYNIKNSRTIEVVLSVGVSSNLKYYIARFDLNRTDIQVQKLNVPAMDLRFHFAKIMDNGKLSFFGIYKNELARLLIMDLETHEVQDYTLLSNSPTNGIVSLLNISESHNEISLFVEGVESFLLFNIDKITKTVSYSTDPIHRFSYLPGQFFTDTLNPVVVSEKLAIFVDSSSINSRNVHTSTSDATGIVTPIKWSVELPENCMSLSPRKNLQTDKNISYNILCKEAETYSLTTYELNKR